MLHDDILPQKVKYEAEMFDDGAYCYHCKGKTVAKAGMSIFLFRPAQKSSVVV